MSETACQVEAPAHHIRISDSINNIRSVVHQIKALKARLNNEPSGVCGGEEKASEPSFIDVLTQTPDHIITQCNEANDILAEINQMLF